MLRSFLIQALIFVFAFQVVSFFRETSMLATDGQLPQQTMEKIEQVPTTMGETVSLNAQGKRKVIYFFAPWCQVCHVSIANLQKLYEQNQHIDVVAVVMDYTSMDEVNSFVQQHQLTLPVALGNEEIKQAFSITGYPSYYVLNEKNIIASRSMGYSTELGLYLRSL